MPNSEDNNKTASPPPRIETHDAAADFEGLAMEIDRGTGKPIEGSLRGHGTTAISEEEEAGNEDTEGAEEEQSAEEGSPEEEGPEQEDAATAEEPSADPGEWNPEDEATVAKFNARYWKKDEAGNETLNLEAFNPELAENLKAGKADISKGGREYLKATLGLSDAVIDQHIKGVINTQAAEDAAWYSAVGGKEVYEAKLAWAKTGYTAEQKARFNAALKSGNKDVIMEQVELLNTRFAAGGGKVPKAASEGGGAAPPKFGPPGKRSGGGVSPQRSATSGSAAGKGTGDIKPFESADEHAKALDAAIKSKDTKAVEEVRRRLKASTFWR